MRDTAKRPPGEKKKSQNIERSLWPKNSPTVEVLKLPVALLLFVLIKLGQIPLKIIFQLILLATKIRIPSITLPRLKKYPKTSLDDKNTLQEKRKNLTQILKRHKRRLASLIFTVKRTLVFLFIPAVFRKKPGRPRLQPLVPFYKKRLLRQLNRLIPSSLRWKIALITVTVVFFTYTFFVFKIASDLPSPSHLTSSNNPLTTQIFDRNGRLLYQIYEGRNRELVKLDDLPPYISQATIAIEDKHFFSHPGVDPFGVIRAMRRNLATNGDAFRGEGGSTITQQLIKNTLLTPDQNVTRKIKEAALAFWTEIIFSKQDILQMYLNEAPYGGPAWGIEAAANMYFGKHAKDLNLAESTFLAGLPAAPTEFSPFGINPGKAKERQREVLRRMVEDGYITQEQESEAMNLELTLRPPTQSIKAPHFVMYVRAQLAQKYGERTVSQGGLKVITSLDLNIQEAAEKIVADNIAKLTALKVGNGAAMVTDPKTGQILAMVGSKDYFDPQGGNYNATTALRQPGSAIKPITYITGFKEGFTPGTVLLDTPTTFTNPWGQAYSPVNYDGRFHGPTTIRVALGSSYNIPAVKMLGMVGVPAMLQTAKEMGITTLNNPTNYGLSLTLGAGAVKMTDMMSVYGVLASSGIRSKIQPILSVTDSAGNILEEHQTDSGRKVLTSEIAYLITNILADNKARVPAFGPNSLLEIPGHTVAVKTGTSDEKRDNWAFGFTPEYVVGAWVGNNDNSPMNPKLASGITGATPIWHDIMIFLVGNQPNKEFQRPANIVEVRVDGHKDLGIVGQNLQTVASFLKSKQAGSVSDPAKGATIYSDQSTGSGPNQVKTTQ